MACVTTMIPVGRHRLAATVFGEGAPAVVIEPAFGGNAAAWRSIAERIAGETTVVTYDRAPYGPSSPARDSRSPARIVADLEQVLGEDWAGREGDTATVCVVATNVYAKTPDGWRLVLHHASPGTEQEAVEVLSDRLH